MFLGIHVIVKKHLNFGKNNLSTNVVLLDIEYL